MVRGGGVKGPRYEFHKFALRTPHACTFLYIPEEVEGRRNLDASTREYLFAIPDWHESFASKLAADAAKQSPTAQVQHKPMFKA